MSREQRLKALASLIRRGRATPEQEREYEALDAAACAEYLAANPPRPVRSLFDLEVTRRMWRADAKGVA